MKKAVLIALSICAILKSTSASDRVEKWKTSVDGAVFSTPVIRQNTIYVGTENGNFLFINAETGAILRTIPIGEPIRSTALILDKRLFVEAQGTLYCFDTETAKEKYRIKTHRPQIDMLDPWDYFHTSPVENNGTVYFAGNNGTIYGVEPATGKVIRKIKTQENNPIRSALTFHNGNLYFGDIYGNVYEHNLSSNVLTIVFKTLEKKPNHPYGLIIGGPIINSDKLVFSNRYNKFTLLNYNTKQIAWSRTDQSGSWWSMIPAIIDDKIIIGGSDNHILSALNINNGEIIWDYITDYNMFCKPLVLDTTIIVGTGDSYLNRRGNGSVFSINHKSGKLINKFRPGGNVFASPVEFCDNVIVCTTTGLIYCLAQSFFKNPQPGDISIDGEIDFEFNNGSSSVATKELHLKNGGEKAVKLDYKVKTNQLLPDTFLRVDGYDDNTYTNGITSLQVQVNRRFLKPGQYSGEIVFTINNETSISKNFAITVEGSPKENESDFEITTFKANEKDLLATFSLKINRDTKIVGLLTPVNSDSIVAFIPRSIMKWGNYNINKEIFSLEGANVPSGKYLLKVKSKEQEVTYKYQIN